jgi:probable HAF family extracellular repeat protein/autotransporter-associated beta strand protein
MKTIPFPHGGWMLRLLAAVIGTTSACADVVFESLPAGGDVMGMGQPGSISSDGSTIVGSGWSISKWGGESFRWTPAGGVQFLESTLPLASRARGTSSDGGVVAGQRFSDYASAFCWSGGVFKSLVANRSSSINDVSKDGKLLVGSNPANLTATPVATKWSVAASGTSAAVSLGDLAGGVAESEANSISGNGSTIVGWGTSASGVEAFRIVGTGAMTALGDLAGGKFFSEAAAVSTDGSVIVGRSHSTKGPEAFRWTAATGMVALGDLPGGAVYSEATGVSGDGTIVVGMSSSTVEADVFLWTASNGMRSLAALCRAAGVDLNGWRFPYCRPLISEDGNSLTGDAISPQMDQVVWRLSGVRELTAQAPVLFWQGDSLANVWDVGTSTIWTDGAAPTSFANSKKVIFDDFGSNVPALAVTGSPAPAAVTVNSSIHYTFSGAGSLVGTMSLLKKGTGILSLAGIYRFSGGTTIEAGTLALSGTLEDTGTLGLVVMPGATLQLLGGTYIGNLQVMAGGTVTGTGTIIGNLTNHGTVTAHTGGLLTLQGVTLNQGTMRLTGGTTLDLEGSFINNGVLDVITGDVNPPTTFVNNGILLDSSSVRVESLIKSGTTVQLSIRSSVGHAYRLERSATMASNSWTPVGTDQEGDGNILTFTDAGGATSSSGFYRIAVVR